MSPTPPDDAGARTAATAQLLCLSFLRPATLHATPVKTLISPQSCRLSNSVWCPLCAVGSDGLCLLFELPVGDLGESW